MPSASTRKISILMAALAAVHAGKLSLDQKVTIESKYQDNDSGTFQHLTPGFAITLRDAMVMMIIVSDNTCTGIVVDRVGLGEIQRWCESIGMTGDHASLRDPAQARPRPHARAGDHHHAQRSGAAARADSAGHHRPGRRAKLGSTPELCRLGLDILSWQKLKARLPSQLPLGTKVAHKTGTGSRGFMDAGIIWKGDRPLCVLTMYTEHVPEALPDGTPGFTAANQLMGRMAQALLRPARLARMGRA